MRLTEDNYVEIAETAIKDICERKDQRGNKLEAGKRAYHH